MYGEKTNYKKARDLLEKNRTLKNFWFNFDERDGSITFSSDVEYYSKSMKLEVRKKALDIRVPEQEKKVMSLLEKSFNMGWEYGS